MTLAAASPPPITNHRKPWVAVLFTFLLPGLGQIYCGEGKRGVTFILFGLPVILSIGFFGAWDFFAGFLITIGVSLGYFLFVLWDALRTARAKREVAPKWYNVWYVYALVIIIPSLVPRDFLRYDVIGYETFKIPSASMLPTVRIGDYIMVALRYYRNNEIHRGDIVVFSLPENKSVTIIKRIVGLPGDTVEIRGSQFFLNSVVQPEEYAKYEGGGIKEGNFGPEKVPSGTVFLLGDNRDHSKDSRFWEHPFLPIDRLKGKVLYVYWSSIETSRIGTTIK